MSLSCTSCESCRASLSPDQLPVQAAACCLVVFSISSLLVAARAAVSQRLMLLAAAQKWCLNIKVCSLSARMLLPSVSQPFAVRSRACVFLETDGLQGVVV